MQCERSKACNYSAHVFLPMLFGVCAGILIKLTFVTLSDSILYYIILILYYVTFFSQIIFYDINNTSYIHIYHMVFYF